MAAKTPKKPAGKVVRKAQKKPAGRTAAKATSVKAKGKSAAAPKRKVARAEGRSKGATTQRAAAAPRAKAAQSAPPPARRKPSSSTAATATRSTSNKNSATSPMPVKKARSVAAAVSPSTGDSPFKNFTPYEPKKGEDYMSGEQLEHFRMILLRWRQELMEEVDRTMHHMQDEAANFPDPADRASQEEEFSIELRTRDRERKLIKKIDQTIDRIDQEDYGYCDTCGVEIGLRRLEARPTASQCVDCKTLDEIKERQQLG
jgi:DnaK suppressor protein